MKRPGHGIRGATPWLLALVPVLVTPALSVRAAAAPAPSAPLSTNAAPPAATPPPQSVFIVSTSPKQGRNPFFPRSMFANTNTNTNRPALIDTSGVVLNGLTSPPRLTAMINGRTFEPGEAGEIRLNNGAKVMVRCLEIKADAVIALIGSQRCELHLRRAL